jgi:hypothetical protein
MAAEKKILTDYDFGAVAKVKNLPAASQNGEAVRYNEFSEVDTNVNDLITLSGVAENVTNLGTFTGSTIPDNSTLTSALQALETEAEANNLTVKANSSAFLTIANNEIEISSLAIAEVKVNTVETSLAAYISNESAEFASLAEGDVLILTAADSQVRSWIHNGGSAGAAADMTRLQTDITPSAIRAYFSGEADHIAYDSGTGVFTFAANAAENILPTSHTWVGLGTPSSVMDFMTKTDAELSGLQGGTSLGVGSVTTAKLAADAVTNAKLADDAVETANIADEQVTTSKMANLAITTGKIAADAIVGAKIADDAVDSEHIAAGAIDLAHMSSNSVDSDQYVDGSIDNVHLAANSVDSANIVSGAVDLVHMSANSIDSDQYVDASIDFEHLSNTCYTTDLSSSASSTELVRADAVKSYVDGKSYVRKLFTAQSLTASTAATLSHSLGQKYVDVRMFDDSNDKEVDFELTLIDANSVSVEVTTSGTYSILCIG